VFALKTPIPHQVQSHGMVLYAAHMLPGHHGDRLQQWYRLVDLRPFEACDNEMTALVQGCPGLFVACVVDSQYVGVEVICVTGLDVLE